MNIKLNISHNLKNPNSKQFTKKDFIKEKPNMSAYDVTYWNSKMINGEPFTKEELLKCKDINYNNVFDWNDQKINTNKISKKEFLKVSGKDALEMIVWNNGKFNKRKFSKKEFINSKGFSSEYAEMWNRYTFFFTFSKKEIEYLKIIENNPIKITKKIFKKYKKIICNEYGCTNYHIFIKTLKTKHI